MPGPSIERKPQIHFVGICGTAMGSVAAAMKQRGYAVSGSDANVYPPMSTFLLEQGIDLTSGFAAGNIPSAVDQVVIGNAIKRGNAEAEAVLDRKLLYTSLPELLRREFLHGKRNLVVAGTHGKTTTASLLAWLLESSGRQPSFMIGGIPRNLGQGARFTGSEFTVLEGDEYDTAFFDKRSKFLHYLPEAVIINNIEFDHADIYDDLEAVKLTFWRLLNIIPQNGIAFINGDDANCLEVAKDHPAPIRVSRVGFGSQCDRRIAEVRETASGSRFSLEGETYEVPLDGEFNVRNAAMSICAARHAGLSPAEIRAGLLSFQGIARRQEIRGVVHGIRIIDDFGHHPTAIRGTLKAMRRRFPEGRIWALFEPRSNTSQRNLFQNELAEALAEADGAILPPISHPEKFAPDDRLDPEKVVQTIRRQFGKEAYCEKDVDAILSRLKPLLVSGDSVVVLSNGGFGGIHDRLLKEL